MRKRPTAALIACHRVAPMVRPTRWHSGGGQCGRFGVVDCLSRPLMGDVGLYTFLIEGPRSKVTHPYPTLVVP
jgi:hypothetical protein